MKEKFNLNKISIIGTVAINDYFLSYFELKKRGLVKNKDSKYHIGGIRKLRRNYFFNMKKSEGYVTAVRKIKNELILNVKHYPFEVISTFIDLTVENCTQASHYLQEKTNRDYLYTIVSLWQSRGLLLINIFSVLFFILTLTKKKNNLLKKDFFVINVTAYAIVLFVYISSGVSIGQGDRFLVPIYFVSYLWFFFQINMQIADYSHPT